MVVKVQQVVKELREQQEIQVVKELRVQQEIQVVKVLREQQEHKVQQVQEHRVQQGLREVKGRQEQEVTHLVRQIIHLVDMDLILTKCLIILILKLRVGYQLLHQMEIPTMLLCGHRKVNNNKISL